MATSKTTNTYNRQNWEDSDFPILCQTCLGDNPYIRMTKEKYGKECKICVRPFTVFRWCPGARMRFKKTEVCQTCSKLKNVCQTCLLDLEYGLPIQVRDAALSMKDDVPKSDVNKEFYIQNMENELNKADSGVLVSSSSSSKINEHNDVLLRLARTAPYYKRNRPHVCSFWVKGECRRGEECPYRHEKPTDPDDPLADQNIRDRYYGVNDPVADKLLKRAAAMPALPLPEDRSITTLYVGNIGTLTEQDLRDHFYQYGEIRSLSVVPKQQCAFVQYTTRAASETAAEKTFNKVVLGGRRLTIKWGRSQARTGASTSSAHAHDLYEPVPGLPRALPELTNNFFNLEPGHIPLPTLPPPPPSLLVNPMLCPPPPPAFFFAPNAAPRFVPPPAQGGHNIIGPPGTGIVAVPGVPGISPAAAVAAVSLANAAAAAAQAAAQAQAQAAAAAAVAAASDISAPGTTNALNIPISIAADLATSAHALATAPLALQQVHYPSQDPSRLGATPLTADKQQE